MFKLGVDTMIWVEEFTTQSLPIINKAKELGFDAIDININHPERFPAKEVKARLKEVGIEAVTTIGLNKDSNLISPDPAVRKNGEKTMKRMVDINMEIGSKICAGVIYAQWGYITGRPRTEAEWNYSVTSMRNIAEYSKKQGDLTLAVEPVGRFESHFLNIAEDAVRYCKDVGVGNVKVHLDTFHMIREEMNFTKAVETCGKEYLGYVHVCENNRGIPGTGLVPWKEFFTALKNIGYNGPACIESFDPSFEETNRLCAIWRKYADTGEELAVQGLKNLKAVQKAVYKN